jgi:hypothetical protein
MARNNIPTVPAFWFRLAPGMSVDFWRQVAIKVRKRKVRKFDLTKVQLIIEEISINGQYKNKHKYYFGFSRGVKDEVKG